MSTISYFIMKWEYSMTCTLLKFINILEVKSKSTSWNFRESFLIFFLWEKNPLSEEQKDKNVPLVPTLHGF